MSASAIHLNYLTALQFTGEDALDFLQGQLTSDVTELGTHKPLFACVCNPKGRVIGLLLLSQADDHSVLAICSRRLAETIHKHLSMYVLRARVSIKVRDDWPVLGLVKTGDVPAGGHLIDHPAGRYALSISSELEPLSGQSRADENLLATWKEKEIVTGIQWLEASTSTAFLPQMLGLQSIGALSFTKGCYPGQEVIARTRHLGKLKRHPLVCVVEGALNAAAMDDALLLSDHDEASAVVVSAIQQDSGNTLLMLVVRFLEDFTPVQLEWSGSVFRIQEARVPGPDASSV